jgi:hypothetical protein
MLLSDMLLSVNIFDNVDISNLIKALDSAKSPPALVPDFPISRI